MEFFNLLLFATLWIVIKLSLKIATSHLFVQWNDFENHGLILPQISSFKRIYLTIL
jgi:hypothetical protein